LIVHSSWETEAPRSTRMVGSAVDTTTVSSAAMKDPIPASITTHAIEDLVFAVTGLIEVSFRGAAWWRPFPLEIRGAVRIHRYREAELRQEVRVAEARDLADLAIRVEVEHDDPLRVQRSVVVRPVRTEGWLPVGT